MPCQGNCSILKSVYCYLSSVYTSYWYMEHWLHICRTLNWKTSLSWEKCCSPIGSDDWFIGNAISRSHCQGIWLLYFVYIVIISHFYFVLHLYRVFGWLKVGYGPQIRNEKARRYLSSMRKKKPIPFSYKFPNADPLALCLLERMLAFDPKDRPTAEEVL